MYRIFDTLDEIVTMIEQARGVPMSTSAMVPRDHILDLLDDLRDRLPEEVTQAKAVLDQRSDLLAVGQREQERLISEGSRIRDELIAQAQQEHDELIAIGRSERERLISESDVYRSAVARADQLGAATAAEADVMRGEVDGYVDAKLAEFEATLSHLLRSVEHGRAKVGNRARKGPGRRAHPDPDLPQSG